MPTDPRLGGNVLGLDPRDAQLASLRQTCADLQRQINDLRAAATIQVGAGTPAGLSARSGAPYAQTNATFWVMLPVGWRGVSLPLT